jgi:hypothetical protein
MASLTLEGPIKVDVFFSNSETTFSFCSFTSYTSSIDSKKTLLCVQEISPQETASQSTERSAKYWRLKEGTKLFSGSRLSLEGKLFNVVYKISLHYSAVSLDST